MMICNTVVAFCICVVFVFALSFLGQRIFIFIVGFAFCIVGFSFA